MRTVLAVALVVAVHAARGQELVPRVSDAPDIAPRATAFGAVVELRNDFGFTPLVGVHFLDGRRASLTVNGGTALALGVSFLPLAGGRLGTRVTAGAKGQLLWASNGSAGFTAFPVELLEFAYAGPLRIGAGGSLLLWPRLRGSGLFEGAGHGFQSAPSAVAEAEWIVSPRTRTGIGARASWTWLSRGGVTVSGPSVGLVLRADLDVTG